MVRAGDRRQLAEAAHPFEHPLDEQRMLLDALVLGARERVGLVEDARGDLPGATVLADHTNADNGLDQSTRLAVRLASWSSALS